MKKLSTQEIDVASKKADPVKLIAIGASAGGLEALKIFFSQLPEGIDYSFVVIQHLSADFKSMMAELISKSTKLKVKDIENEEVVRSGYIYTLPPGHNLYMENHALKLKARPNKSELNLPIDIFLRSYAEAYREQAISIILTGTGSDGTRGIRSIKENGGMVMVQDPNDAKFDGMPRSAVNSGLADYILPVVELPNALCAYIEHNYNHKLSYGDEKPEDADIDQIIQLISREVRLDFSEYKKATIIRRINHRMHINGVSSYKQYIQFLKKNAEEIDLLYREFLIGVSRFFRDKEAFDILAKQIIPVLVRSRKDGETLKIWSVGCSTGEEPYSVSILIQEELRKQGKQLDVKIFATDIDKTALERASKGFYSESIKADIPPELLKKYFVPKGDLYQVKETIRRPIIFSYHNVTTDPGFNRIDLLSCRNLLIYLNNDLQQRVLALLHYALNLHGYLFLGSSESVGDLSRYLDVVHGKSKLWQKNTLVRASNLRLKRDVSIAGGSSIGSSASIASNVLPNVKITDILESLSESSGSVFMLVTDDLKLIEAFGPLHKFAHFPDKGFSTDLKQIFPSELALTLSTSIKKIHSDHEPIRLSELPVRSEKTNALVDVSIAAVKKAYNHMSNLYLVSIRETGKELKAQLPEKWEDPGDISHQRIEDLEYELKLTKDNLEHTIEELETSNEELQATNEELLASNEELQSTNEELQSVNEELYSVNSEYQYKVTELEELNSDLDNLFASTNVGIIFLTQDLRIRKFTPAFRDIFSLLPTDSGRSIRSFKSKLPADQHEILVGRIERAARNGISDELEIHNGNDVWYQVRITATLDSTTENGNGLVVSFTDVSSIKQLSEQLKLQEETYRSIFNSSMVGIWQIDMLFLFDWVTQMRREGVRNIRAYLKKRPSELDSLVDQLHLHRVNTFTLELFKAESSDEFKEHYKKILRKPLRELIIESAKSLSDAKSSTELFGIRMRTTKSRTIHANISIAWPQEPEAFRTINITLSEITNLVKTSQKLEKQQELLEQKNSTLSDMVQQMEQFTYIVSHDMRSPLANMTSLISLIDQEKLHPDNQPLIKDIGNSVTKLDWVIKSLNKVIESKKLEALPAERTDLNKTINGVLKDLNSLVEKSKATVEVELNDQPEVWLPAVHANSVIQNLLTNAIKHSHQKEKTLISVKGYQKGNLYITDIQDNGPGVPKEAQERIFRAFERLDKRIQGEGIGLFLTKSLLLKYNGTIELVDPQPDKGALFRISWPTEAKN